MADPIAPGLAGPSGDPTGTTKRKKRKKRFRGRLRRPRLPKVDLQKALFVLPNLFTVSSIFCGFYAIVLTSDHPGPTQFYQATLAIFFGTIFDMVDGRVARLTKTQSEFGVQMDSLADLVTFGVAPGVILYRWALEPLGVGGTLASFTFVACGAIRLARFNVMAGRSKGSPSAHFVGLPIPLAAGVVASLIMFHQRTYQGPPVHASNIVALVLILSYLMVSNVRYQSFKKVKPTAVTFAVFASLAFGFIVLATVVAPTFALFVFFCVYVGLGLLEEVIFFRRRRREARASKETTPPPTTTG